MSRTHPHLPLPFPTAPRIPPGDAGALFDVAATSALPDLRERLLAAGGLDEQTVEAVLPYAQGRLALALAGVRAAARQQPPRPALQDDDPDDAASYAEAIGTLATLAVSLVAEGVVNEVLAAREKALTTLRAWNAQRPINRNPEQWEVDRETEHVRRQVAHVSVLTEEDKRIAQAMQERDKRQHASLLAEQERVARLRAEREREQQQQRAADELMNPWQPPPPSGSGQPDE